MFGKKKTATASNANNKKAVATDDYDNTDVPAPPLKPFTKKGSHAPAKPPHNPSYGAPLNNEQNRRPPSIPSPPQRHISRSMGAEVDSKCLLVGRDISISGEITACEKLIVEGQVAATLPSARMIEVAPSGLFRGKADVEEADISGNFDGELTVSGKLTVRTGGHISGIIRYGTVIIEQGGNISGDMATIPETALDTDVS